MSSFQDKALEESSLAIKNNLPHSRIYRALALLDSGFGTRQAQKEVDLYLESLSNNESHGPRFADPILLFVLYTLWKIDPDQVRSKSAKLRAADALAAFRCFPDHCSRWLSENDNVDIQVIKDGLDNEDEIDVEVVDDENDDDLSSLPSPADPEHQWKIAKESTGVVRQYLCSLFIVIILCFRSLHQWTS